MELSKIKKVIPFYFVNILLTIIGSILPLLESGVIDNLIYNKNEIIFYNYILIMIGVIIVQFVIGYFVDKYKFIVKEKLTLSMINDEVNFLFTKNTKQVLFYNPNYLHNRLLEDISQIWSFYFETVSGIIVNIVSLIIVSLILLNTNLIIFVITLFSIPIYVVIYTKFHKVLTAVEYDVSESANSLYAYRENIFQRYLEIKSKQIINNEIKRISSIEGSFIQNIYRSFRIHYRIYGIKLFTSSTLKIIVFITIGYIVLKENLTIGVFLYTSQYMNSVLICVDGLMQLFLQIPKYKVSLQRMAEMKRIKFDKDNGEVLRKVTKIEVTDFNFYYNESPLYSEPINFTFNSGSLYTITGKNGVGKSTLFLSLLGVFSEENYLGKITFDGLNIKDLNNKELRKNLISIMLQHNSYNSKTVEEYLIDHDISNFEKVSNDNVFQDVFFSEEFNLSKKLKDKCDDLSGGERQLLSLFVCVVKSADVFLLDEPLASLHPIFKIKVQKLLKRISNREKIVICITHDDILVNSNEMHIL
ncbi:TPA: ABC transporter ATP-binding protein [Streptococcus suis]|nr:ABC transporter ATP-binding protein [Streptococcus suis]